MRTAVLILRVLRPSGGISLSSRSAATAMASSVLAGLGTPSKTCSSVSSASYSAVAEIAYFKARPEFSEKSAQKRIRLKWCTWPCSLPAATEPCGGLLAASTGQGAVRITRSVTDPSIRRSNPRRFLRLRKRQNRVRGHSLVHYELRLNFIVGVVL